MGASVLRGVLRARGAPGATVRAKMGFWAGNADYFFILGWEGVARRGRGFSSEVGFAVARHGVDPGVRSHPRAEAVWIAKVGSERVGASESISRACGMVVADNRAARKRARACGWRSRGNRAREYCNRRECGRVARFVPIEGCVDRRGVRAREKIPSAEADPTGHSCGTNPGGAIWSRRSRRYAPA